MRLWWVTTGIGRKLVSVALGLALALTVSVSLAFGAMSEPPVNAGFNSSYGPVSNFSPGYWKTHDAVTTAFLPQRLGEYYTVDTFTKAKRVLSELGCGHFGTLVCMAGMLLATELNLAQGGSTCINSVVAEANAFLTKYVYGGYLGSNLPYVLSASDEVLAKTLHAELSAYNIDGVPSC